MSEARTRWIVGGLLVAIAGLAIALGADHGRPASAQAPSGGMSLGATEAANCTAQGCTVASSAAFSITVRADPAPNFDLGGFAAELGLDGLVWQMRDCYTDLQVDRANGDRAGVCVSEPGSAGEPRYVVISAVQQPPLPPLEDLSAGDVLLEVAVRCPVPGTYDLSLYSLSEARPFGAFYAQTDASQFPVPGQGNPPAADTLQVTCQGPGGTGFQSPVAVETDSGATPPPPDGGNGTPGGGATATGGATTPGTEPGTEQGTPGDGTVSPEDATATALAAAAAGQGGDDDGDDSDSVWLWVIVGLAVAGAAGGLGYLAWRRYRGGGAGPADGAPAPPPDAAA